jgi:hypothetical protein
MAERNSTGQKTKRFKSSAPKGSKLAEGYRDRTQDRVDVEADDKAQRIKALEEQMKLGQIEEDTFQQLRDEITGGDISSTHLVKGLDFKLLGRIRRGEKVMQAGSKQEEGETELAIDIDEEFEELEKQEVAPEAKEERVKKGEMAPPPPVAGQKRTRDQILAELKAQRKAAAEAKAASQPQLGTKFRKIGESDGPRIERDNKGREVLITVDAEGNVKRKVRKVRNEEAEVVLDKDAKPLGADVVVPQLPAAQPSEDEDEDIFEGIGHTFNPLADLGDEESGSEEESAAEVIMKSPSASLIEERPGRHSKSDSDSVNSDVSDSEPLPPEDAPKAILSTKPPRNYFNDDPSTMSVLGNLKNDLKDPAVLAALANSRKLDPSKLSEESKTSSAEDEAKLKRHAAMLANKDRDMEDLDMGFGSSRFDDAEEMATEGSKMKLAQWKGFGKDDEDEDRQGDGSGKKRKRGPKKRKGDKDSPADVLRVMEGKKKG